MPPTTAEAHSELEDLEIRLLLEGIFGHFGFDFRNYALASIRRRIAACMRSESIHTVSCLQDRVLHDPQCMDRLLLSLTVNVTSMFRDPSFYDAFRAHVVPLLKTYPFVRIWHAGCSTGEEVYSMAILLHEEGLYPRCRIYATDVSDAALRKAKLGIFPIAAMQEYTDNYVRAGGKRAFSEYYTAMYEGAAFRPYLQEHIVFAEHNLATDASFNEFNVILCRNVMIYFNSALQERVHGLIYESLDRFGVLAVGRKESLRFTPHESCYAEIQAAEKLFRKVN
jgi:chemotaxis protein methyltransferase CheR